MQTQETPSFSICPCCGTEFGADDQRMTDVLSRRESWIKVQGKWFQPALRPVDFDMKRQLKNVPAEWTLDPD